MSSILVVICIFTAVSCCLSIYCVINAITYEKIRVNARDNEDVLAKLERDLKNLRHSCGTRFKKLESTRTQNDLAGMIANALGQPQNSEDPEDDYEEEL